MIEGHFIPKRFRPNGTAATPRRDAGAPPGQFDPAIHLREPLMLQLQRQQIREQRRAFFLIQISDQAPDHGPAIVVSSPAAVLSSGGDSLGLPHRAKHANVIAASEFRVPYFQYRGQIPALCPKRNDGASVSGTHKGAGRRCRLAYVARCSLTKRNAENSPIPSPR
jgi:hypothetical protein